MMVVPTVAPWGYPTVVSMAVSMVELWVASMVAMSAWQPVAVLVDWWGHSWETMWDGT
jgi:hypothetical protein